MFQKRDVHDMKCFRNATFKTSNVSKTSRFWNIVWTLGTLLLCPVTFLKHFMFWSSRFWNVSCFKYHISETFNVLNVTFLRLWSFERHVSEIFHVLNVTFLEHFIFGISYFWNISVFEPCPWKHSIFAFLKYFIYWTSHFQNISSFKLHFSETLFEHLIPFCCARLQLNMKKNVLESFFSIPPWFENVYRLSHSVDPCSVGIPFRERPHLFNCGNILPYAD